MKRQTMLRSLELALDKLNSNTSTEAQRCLKRGGKVSLGGALARAVHRFLKNYLWKRGFLDGVQGLLYCYMSGYDVFLYHMKVWEQQRSR